MTCGFEGPGLHGNLHIKTAGVGEFWTTGFSHWLTTRHLSKGRKKTIKMLKRSAVFCFYKPGHNKDTNTLLLKNVHSYNQTELLCRYRSCVDTSGE